MKIPLHIKPTDKSVEANLGRIALFGEMFRMTGGKGFRHPSPRMEKLGRESFAS